MSGSERYFENTFQDYDGRTSLQSPDGKVKRETYFLFSLCVMQFVFSTLIQNQVMFEISLLHLYDAVWRCLDNDCLHVSLQIAEPFLSRLKDETYKLLKQCEEGFQYTRDDRDYSVYTGSGGRLIPLRHSQLLTTYRPGGSENSERGDWDTCQLYRYC